MACVRYWAAARELAGTSAEPVAGGSLAEVLAAVAAAHGPRMAALLGRSVVLLDGAQVARDAVAAVTDASTVEVLPPYAGGAR